MFDSILLYPRFKDTKWLNFVDFLSLVVFAMKWSYLLVKHRKGWADQTTLKFIKFKSSTKKSRKLEKCVSWQTRQDTDRTQVWWISKMLVRQWFRTLGVSVCVCSLDGESCECELCLGLDGGYGEGGKIGRCHYSATLPSLFLGHKRLLKKRWDSIYKSSK